jgi:hypothetical protein
VKQIDAVVTHHVDTYRSGVARFNAILAGKLGVPMVPLRDLAGARPECPLLSFKVEEFDDAAVSAVEAWLALSPAEWDVFQHVWSGSELEQRLVNAARRVLCGNAEIQRELAGSVPHAELLWSPATILDNRTFPTADISVFSFGMAHKLQVASFEHLRDLLEATGRSFAVYVSAANHETASIREAEVVFAEMQELFPTSLFFLGNLSDVAVSNYLRESTFFAAFFPGGVRANNSSVMAALEHGSVVLTNLDEDSPPEYVHLESVVDVERCDALPLDPQMLETLSRNAVEVARKHSWEPFLARVRV